MHKLSQEQYQAMLDALEEKGGVALADRSYVEMWLIYGRWSASKLTGIGLEVSDFSIEKETEIKLSHAEVREAQRRCYKRALEVVEEKMRYHEKTTQEQRQSDTLVVEYQQALGEMNNNLIESERMMEFYKRSHEASLRKVATIEETAKRKITALEAEINQLRRKIAEYLTGDPSNQAAVDNAMAEPRYEQFQEAA